jgi:hypothetical protein
MDGVPGAPGEVRWDNQAAEFVDFLIENDLRYVNLQEAIEQLIHSGLKHAIAVPFAVIANEVVYWHPVPKLFPDMRQIHIFWTEDADGGLTVLEAAFASQVAGAY